MDRTYYAEPRNVNPATPSVVLAMHLWGVDADMRQAADRFAAEGFAVDVPDLYAQFDAPSGDGETDYAKFLPHAQKLTTELIDAAFRAAALRLKQHFSQTNTAIAGFCMGGKIALHRTIGYSDIFGAAAIWYGAIEIEPAQVEIPLVASYAADDKGIPTEKVRELEKDLRVPHDVKVYPNTQHAFCDSTRAAYNAAAAHDSWGRTIAFLRKHMV
jgi:carboxymethylenebutenolidase